MAVSGEGPLQENKRMLVKLIRDLAREREGLQDQERKFTAEIKKTVEQGQMENKRMLDKSIRDIEKETQGLQAQEKKIIAEFKKTTEQGQMENKRMLDKSIRDIERERLGLKTQQKKLIAEIKQTAKQGQMEENRMPDKSIRDIEREMQGLQAQLKKLIAEIKKTAEKGQMVNERMLNKSIWDIERKTQGLQAQVKKLIVEIKRTVEQGQMENKRLLDKSIRDTARERQDFHAQLEKLIAEIKKIVEQGQMENKRMPESIKDIERKSQSLRAQEKKLIVEIKKTAEQGQMENRMLDKSIKDIKRKRHGLRAQEEQFIVKIQKTRQMMLIRDRHHPHDLLLSVVEIKPFMCYGCREMGSGPRYTCIERCGYVVHKDCANPKEKLRHVFFPDCDFHFLKQGKPNRRCDACDGDILGYVYHCFDKKGWDLHPCCFNLEPSVLIKEGDKIMLLTLHDKELNRCCICGIKRLNRNASSWTYVSDCKEYHFHVTCVKTEKIKGELIKGSGLEIEKLANILSVPARRASKFAKMDKLVKIAIGIVMAVVFGDPSMFFISVWRALSHK